MLGPSALLRNETTSTAVRVKVCCIRSREEAQLALAAGAQALGLVSAMPSGPGVISEAEIASIARIVPPGTDSFLLTSQQRVEDIVTQQRRCRTTTIQLCDRPIDGSYSALRDALPGIGIVQVLHIQGPDSVEEALELEPHVDALLLDSGNPQLAVKQLGGTGRVHDWEVSAAIRRAVNIPIFLAGGLHAGNVREAIVRVQPWGVDVCNGVRSDGKLDRVRLQAFLAACALTEQRLT